MTTLEPKVDSSGALYKVPLNQTTVLNIFTNSGGYRGGKSYSEDKYFTIISGSTEVTTFDGKEDIKNNYTPGKLFKIPANVPNIFYFPEDCEMLERFPKDVATEKFERYSEMKK